MTGPKLVAPSPSEETWRDIFGCAPARTGCSSTLTRTATRWWRRSGTAMGSTRNERRRMARARQIIERGGKRFVLVEESEYRRLSRAAAAGAPALPEADSDGNRPAVPFARAVIARSLIEQRTRLGWTQAELARRSGVRAETLNRIERGRVTPDTATIAKLDALL